MKTGIGRIITLCFLCFSFTLSAGTLKDAEDAYNSEDYSKCIEIYNEIIQSKGTSAPLLLNLGNAYVKAGDYGKAMVCYQKALLLDPSDKQVKSNINYLNTKVEDNNRAETKGKKVSVIPQDKSFFSSLNEYIVYSHLPDTWAIWAAVMFILTIICVTVYFFSNVVILRKIGFFGGFCTMAISLITLCFSFISVSGRNKLSRGVIIGHKVYLHSDPYQSSKTGPYPLTRGTLLSITGEETNEEGDDGKGELWYKVRLNSDYSGWIKSEDFEVILPDFAG